MPEAGVSSASSGRLAAQLCSSVPFEPDTRDLCRGAGVTLWVRRPVVKVPKNSEVGASSRCGAWKPERRRLPQSELPAAARRPEGRCRWPAANLRLRLSPLRRRLGLAGRRHLASVLASLFALSRHFRNAVWYGPSPQRRRPQPTRPRAGAIPQAMPALSAPAHRYPSERRCRWAKNPRRCRQPATYCGRTAAVYCGQPAAAGAARRL